MMTTPSAQSQANDLEAPQSVVRFPLWVSIVVILGALLILAGAVISKVDPTLLTNGSPMTVAARVYADYLFARNLALAVMLFFLLAIRARRMLAGFMVLVAFIQLVDIVDEPFSRSSSARSRLARVRHRVPAWSGATVRTGRLARRCLARAIGVMLPASGIEGHDSVSSLQSQPGPRHALGWSRMKQVVLLLSSRESKRLGQFRPQPDQRGLLARAMSY